MIKYRLVFTFLFVVVLGCADNESSGELDSSPLVSKPEVGNQTSSARKSQKNNKPLYPRLNSDNCVDFLLEFGKENPETKIVMHTSKGDIEIELLEETPLHRANFVYLIKREYFNPTEILRIVKGFIIQGGNSEAEVPQEKRWIIGDYCLPLKYVLNIFTDEVP